MSGRARFERGLSWLVLLTGLPGVLLLMLAVRRSRLPYNSEGNYFDGVTNISQQSVVAFTTLGMALVALALAAFIARRALRARRGR